jgi:hypothetical protein
MKGNDVCFEPLKGPFMPFVVHVDADNASPEEHRSGTLPFGQQEQFFGHKKEYSFSEPCGTGDTVQP